MISAAALVGPSLLLVVALGAPPGLNEDRGHFGNWNPQGGTGGGGGADYDNSGSWGNNNNNHNSNNFRRTIAIATYDYDDYGRQSPSYGHRRHHHPNRGGYGPPMNQFDRGGYGGRSSYGYQGQQSHSNYGAPRNMQYGTDRGHAGRDSFDYNDHHDGSPNHGYGSPMNGYGRKSSYGYQGPPNTQSEYTPPPPRKSSYGYQGPRPQQDNVSAGYGRKIPNGYPGAAATNTGPNYLPGFSLSSKTSAKPQIEIPPSSSLDETNIVAAPLPPPPRQRARDEFNEQTDGQAPPLRPLPTLLNKQPPSIPPPPVHPPPPSSTDQETSNGNEIPRSIPSFPPSNEPTSIPEIKSEFHIPPPPVPPPPAPMDEQQQPQFQIPTPPPPPPPPPMDPESMGVMVGKGGNSQPQIPTPPPPPPPPPMDFESIAAAINKANSRGFNRASVPSPPVG